MKSAKFNYDQINISYQNFKYIQNFKPYLWYPKLPIVIFMSLFNPQNM